MSFRKHKYRKKMKAVSQQVSQKYLY